MHEEDPQKKIRRVALDYLARRDYSQHTLVQKLKTKGYVSSDIDTVIANLVQKGLINDKLFAENYIYHRRTKGYGPERVRRELEAHKIDAEMIAELLNITDNAWLNVAQKLWQKRFKGKFPSDLKTRAKQMRFLQYRGFTREQINNVIPRNATRDEESCHPEERFA